MIKQILKKKITFFYSHKWIIIGLWILITFIFGYIGFAEYKENSGQTCNPYNIIFSVFQLFFIEFNEITPDINWKLEIARWFAIMISGLAAVKVLKLIFKEQIQEIRLRYSRKKRIIICGLSRKGLFLSKQFNDNNYKVVIIEQDENNDLLEQCKKNGSVVIIGNALESKILEKARIHETSYLIAVCKEDGMNAAIATQARELYNPKDKKKLKSIIHIVNPQLFRLIREWEFEIENRKENDYFQLEFFNIHDLTAKVLLLKYPPISTVNDSKNHSSMIIGTDGLGESLLLNMALFLREKLNNSQIQNYTIFYVGKDVFNKLNLLKQQFKYLDCIVDIKPISEDVTSLNFKNGEFTQDGNSYLLDKIYICFDTDADSLKTALDIYKQVRDFELPIIIPLDQNVGLTGIIQGSRKRKTNLYDFSISEQVLTPDRLLKGTIETIAIAVHNNYLEKEMQKKNNNPSAVSWEELPENLKESNRRQAEHIGIKLNTIGCYIAPLTEYNYDPKFTNKEIEDMSIMEHDRWLEEKKSDGWTYSENEKNQEKKTNPCIVPWEKLTEEDKEKDRDAVRQIPHILATVGFQIFRSQTIDNNNQKQD